MRKKRKIIGICGSCLFNQQPTQFINQLHEQSIKYGYCITALSCSTNSVEDSVDSIADRSLINLIEYLPLSGMIILTETIKNPKLLDYILHACNKKHIPVFSVDGSLDGCYNMTLDNSSGFEDMVRHIIEFHGCRNVNLLAGIKGNAISDERVSVYKKVLTENHIPIEEERIGYGDFWERPARKAIQNFLHSDLPLPEAIICANDAMAVATCSELHKSGYNVPEDILVTGFDGIIYGQYHFPVTTTCEPDFADAVSFIIRELENYLSTQKFAPHKHDITYIPRYKQSCGCEPKTVYNMNHVISTLYENSGDSSWHNIAMNQLITSNLDNDNISTLIEILPEYTHLWRDHFRFACVKSSMLSSTKFEDDFTEMVSILNLRSGEFRTVGEIFPIEDFIPDIDAIENTDVFMVRLLNSGETVYGYSVEGFNYIEERGMQRCNDFGFFLSYCLNTIVHNARHKKLTEGLLKANHEVSMLALHDSMTRLYNRQGFYEKLTPLLSATEQLGKFLYIFSIDMNRLKYINDTFGHADGDFAITTLANAIKRTVGDDAICARFGGDEFVVAIIYDRENALSADVFSQKLLTYIDTSEGVSDKPYPIRASVGVQCLPITPTINVESMIAAADEKMYIMKKESRKSARES